MTEQNAPERIWAWPNRDFRGWYAGGCSTESLMDGTECAEYVRADLYDAAIRREMALLASNDEDRKGLVEAASLRHRLKVMTAERDAAHNAAIEAAAKRCHEDQGRFDTPDRIRALRREPRA